MSDSDFEFAQGGPTLAAEYAQFETYWHYVSVFMVYFPQSMAVR